MKKRTVARPLEAKASLAGEPDSVEFVDPDVRALFAEEPKRKANFKLNAKARLLASHPDERPKPSGT